MGYKGHAFCLPSPIGSTDGKAEWMKEQANITAFYRKVSSSESCFFFSDLKFYLLTSFLLRMASAASDVLHSSPTPPTHPTPHVDSPLRPILKLPLKISTPTTSSQILVLMNYRHGAPSSTPKSPGTKHHPSFRLSALRIRLIPVVCISVIVMGSCRCI